MKRKDIVTRIARRTTIPKAIIDLIIDGFILVVSELISEGHDINLSRLGTFTLKKHKARKSRDLTNMRQMETPERYVVKYIPSGDIKKAVSEVTISERDKNKDPNKVDGRVSRLKRRYTEALIKSKSNTDDE